MIKKKFTKDKWLFLTIIVLSVIVVALFINVYVPKSTEEKKYSAEIIEIKEECKECFDVGVLADNLIKENNIEVKSRKTLDYNSQESKKIIEKYSIKSVPALLILSKDIEEMEMDEEIFSVSKDYALFDRSVPYTDLLTKDVKGLVNLKEIQAGNCIECASLMNLKTQFEQIGIKIKDYEIIDSSSEIGKELIAKNDLEFVPVLLISKNIEEYWWIFDQLKDSLIEKEDNYVLKNPILPYLELKDRKIKGKVEITFIKNKSCEDCFDIQQLKGSFMSLGIYLEKERSIDVSSDEGKNLLKRYNITAIPTLTLSKEIRDYKNIGGVLEQIGTFESDGKFVFRKVESLNAKFQEIG